LVVYEDDDDDDGDGNDDVLMVMMVMMMMMMVLVGVLEGKEATETCTLRLKLPSLLCQHHFALLRYPITLAFRK